MIKEAMEAAAAAAQIVKDTKNPSASWHYENCVHEALKPFTPARDKATAAENNVITRAFYVEIEKAARFADKDRGYGVPWTGYTAVAAVLSSTIAWLTPGFAEARRYNNLYGS